MVAVSKLGEIEYREIPVDVKPEVRVEGGQHLNGFDELLEQFSIARPKGLTVMTKEEDLPSYQALRERERPKALDRVQTWALRSARQRGRGSASAY